jgi:AAA15 family ATPase/GTPase
MNISKGKDFRFIMQADIFREKITVFNPIGDFPVLIRFIVENFSSFGGQAELSMVAGRQQIHPEHLVDAPQNKLKLLRTAAIYGANASGKSNLVKAMQFAKKFIVNGTSPMGRIPVTPFLLDSTLKKAASTFQFSYSHKGNSYTYGFKVNSEKVVEEWLFSLVGQKENILFERNTDPKGNAQVKFAPTLIANAEEKSFLTLLARGTRQNQLFLTETVQRNYKSFLDSWFWFNERLTIVLPDTFLGGLQFKFKDEKSVAPVFMDLLRTFDTGIVGIDTQEMPFDSLPGISSEQRENIESLIQNFNTEVTIVGPGGSHYILRRKENGEITALKLRTCHQMRDSKESVLFDFSDESDGTRRIVDLLPTMTGLLSEDKVVVIDEIDRSLHPHVAYAFFDLFLREGKQCHSQLIATTHAENLLTFKLLRKDEIWFIDKNRDGESKLYSLEEFKPRHDKDIMDGYMKGRFGAIPAIVKVPNPLAKECSTNADY